MGEFLQKAETAIQQVNAQMTRYRALETMEEAAYNPVSELIDIARDLKKWRKSEDASERLTADVDLETKIHTKLLEYYSAAPKKQMQLDVQQEHQIVILPVSHAARYDGKDLEPHKPKLIDVTPKKTVLEAMLEPLPSDSDTES